MDKLTFDLPPDLLGRFEALATRMGHSLEECARRALVEFMDNWEDHLRTLAALEEEEARPQWTALGTASGKGVAE